MLCMCCQCVEEKFLEQSIPACPECGKIIGVKQVDEQGKEVFICSEFHTFQSIEG